MKQQLNILTNNALPALIPNDAAVVLLQEASYLLLQELKYKTIYALEADLIARGLKTRSATLINYDELVKLTTQYDKIITWT